jgi:hypothetical protein
MKIQLNNRPAGNAMLLALFTAFVISVSLSSYLYLVSNQNQSVFRSMAWNSAIPVVEAGFEEALTHLQYSSSANLACDGWSVIGTDGFSHKIGNLGNGFSYDVGIKPPAAGAPDVPTIECVGYTLAPANYASYQSTLGMILGGLVPQFTTDKPVSKRKVRVMAKRQSPVQFAMLAKGQIDLNGKNIQTDSFDSTNPLFSTNGVYTASKAKDKGDIATNSGIVNAIRAGNARIKGHASTGPNGSLDIGPNGSIGNKAWVEGNTNGVMTGWVTDDTNVDIDDAKLPFTGGGIPYLTNTQYPPSTGPTYDFIFATGNYRLSDLKGTVLITGAAKVIVDSTFEFKGSDQITIASGASLEVYVGATNAKLGGNGVVNQNGDAFAFQYYGLNSNTSLAFNGNAAFTGVVYAPYADFTLGGGGNNTYDFVGASVTKTVTMNGHFNFHYDESLAGRFPIRGYVVSSWNEIDPNSSN